MTIARTRRGIPSDAGPTFHVMGDLHFNNAGGGFQLWRQNVLLYDLTRLNFVPLAHIQVGDGTDNGSVTENTQLEDWKDLIVDAPVLLAVGNHDCFDQTVAEWATRWGYATKDHYADYPGVRVIVIGGEVGEERITVATLDWLEDRLADASPNPCIIIEHYPLYDTAMGDPAFEFTSTEAGFFCNTQAEWLTSDDILDRLALHSNVKAFISGHTHSHMTVPGFIKQMTAGVATFAAINATSPWYQGRALGTLGGNLDYLRSLFVTVEEDRIEIRFRDHGAGLWIAPAGEFVTTVMT